jgi:hypothetical protein
LKTVDAGHNGILLLLKLYYEYMTEKAIVFDEMSITVLENALPVSGLVNHGKQHAPGSFTYYGGHGAFCKSKLTELSSLLPKEYRFTHFVEEVINGRQNVDKYEGFHEHMRDFLEESIATFDDLDDDAKNELMVTDYEPPEDPGNDTSDDDEGHDKPVRTKTPGETVHFFKLVKAMYNLSGEPRKDEKYVTILPSKDEISEGFDQLYRAGCVLEVKFDAHKLKAAHMGGQVEDKGFMGKVMATVREDMDELRKEKNAKLKQKKTETMSGMKRKRVSSGDGGKGW